MLDFMTGPCMSAECCMVTGVNHSCCFLLDRLIRFLSMWVSYRYVYWNCAFPCGHVFLFFHVQTRCGLCVIVMHCRDLNNQERKQFDVHLSLSLSFSLMWECVHAHTDTSFEHLKDDFFIFLKACHHVMTNCGLVQVCISNKDALFLLFHVSNFPGR